VGAPEHVPIIARCYNRHEIRVADEQVGTSVECPECKLPVKVPVPNSRQLGEPRKAIVFAILFGLIALAGVGVAVYFLYGKTVELMGPAFGTLVWLLGLGRVGLGAWVGYSLYRPQHKLSVAEVCYLLRRGEPKSRRLQAARELGEHHTRQSTDELLLAMHDPDADIRVAAAKALARTRFRSASPHLIVLLANEPQDGVKAAITLALQSCVKASFGDPSEPDTWAKWQTWWDTEGVTRSWKG
jgi:hypothetical protein